MPSPRVTFRSRRHCSPFHYAFAHPLPTEPWPTLGDAPAARLLEPTHPPQQPRCTRPRSAPRASHPGATKYPSQATGLASMSLQMGAAGVCHGLGPWKPSAPGTFPQPLAAEPSARRLPASSNGSSFPAPIATTPRLLGDTPEGRRTPRHTCTAVGDLGARSLFPEQCKKRGGWSTVLGAPPGQPSPKPTPTPAADEGVLEGPHHLAHPSDFKRPRSSSPAPAGAPTPSPGSRRLLARRTRFPRGPRPEQPPRSSPCLIGCQRLGLITSSPRTPPLSGTADAPAQPPRKRRPCLRRAERPAPPRPGPPALSGEGARRAATTAEGRGAPHPPPPALKPAGTPGQVPRRARAPPREVSGTRAAEGGGPERPVTPHAGGTLSHAAAPEQ